MRPTEPHKLLRFIEGRPYHARALQSLGNWYRKRGRPDEARDAWECALAMNPCDPFTHLYLGNLAYERRDLAAALERFHDAEMLAPALSVPLWCQADVYEALGRQDLAEEYHRRSVELEPDNERPRLLMEKWKGRRDGSGHTG